MTEIKFDPATVEAVEWALAIHFSSNRQPAMSGDPRDRLSALQRRNMELARDSVLLTLAARGELVLPGWQSVPQEPTKNMLWAADLAHFTGEDDPHKPGFVLFGQTREEYLAMLAAAPCAGKNSHS